MKFVGRNQELSKINALYHMNQSQLVVIYGRRRIGKSRLIEQFIRDKPYLRFEGLEGGQTPAQITNFMQDLARQLNDPMLEVAHIHSWNLIFDYLTRYFEQAKQKYIFFIDELPWLAAGQSKLTSLIKKYWDQHWSKQNILLILCGSVSSYMVKKVIKSKALYGRVNYELCLQAFSLNETYELLGKKRSKEEVLLYQMVLGGIPKYLNEINSSHSFDQNINKLFFENDGALTNEYSKIFYSQFKEYHLYEMIVRLLNERPLSLKEISNKIRFSSGGGLKFYLDNLENALFITCYTPFDKQLSSSLKKYKLTDEYLRFYFKYIEPYQQLIASNRSRNLFVQQVKSVWQSWLGFSYENFCLKNALSLAEAMGFGDQVLYWGPAFTRDSENFQVDLVFKRSDKVITLCEIKYHQKPITIAVVKEVEKKINLISVPRGFTLEKALITPHGVEPALKELDYFHHVLTINDLFLK